MSTEKKINLWLPLLISVSVVLGMFIGFKLRDDMPRQSFFHTARQKPFDEIMELIRNKYVDTVDTYKLADTAIQAVLQKLDPHSVYIPASQLQEVNDDIQGSFYGIGIEFTIFDDSMHVVQVLPGGPSFKAGLQRGDRVLKVDGKPISGNNLATDSIRKRMRGEQGSTVVLSIWRNGQLKDIRITRDYIPVSSIDAAFLLQPGTGYIRLNKFSSQTYHDFMVNLDSLVKLGIGQLVLDLRGNGGGLLDEAVEIADEFLDGDKLITYTEGRAFPRKEYRCRRNGLFEKGKLVVLADEGSASASEVLMGALQDWDRATIIGRRSFGKGLVQEQFDLSDRSALRLTIARYYTPTGRSIQRSYAQGGKAYYDAIHHRMLEDSLGNQDVIDSSQVFHTKKGKIVYGGGGISPDILMPTDSVKLNVSLLQALANGLVFDFGYRLLMLKPALNKAYASTADFEANYQPDAFDWSVLQAMAAKDSVTLSENDKIYLSRRLKASVARQLWRNAGYYEVMSRQDPYVLKALEWLKK